MKLFLIQETMESWMGQQVTHSGLPYTVIDSILDAPDEKSSLILTEKRDVYCHPCPATKLYRCCNYHTSDVMEGCPFDCSYCILQAYLGHKSIQISSDTEGIVSAVKQAVNSGKKLRLGTGELSDSLALDHIFPFTKLLVPLVNEQEGVQFEFKTKSANINNLLNLNPQGVLVSWSLNPQSIVLTEEKGAAPVAERIKAAKACAEAGYKLGFHFDPLIYTASFHKDYGALVEELVMSIPEQAVDYISLSTFRGPAALIDKMRERPDRSLLLKSDLIMAPDGKLRYFKALRLEMLKYMTDLFSKYWPSVFTYYCMEHETVWEKLKGFDPGDRESFETLFPWHVQAGR